MIWYTVEQAAERVHVTRRTIRRWITDGDVTAASVPVLPGIVLIEEQELCAAYRRVRARQGAATRFKTRT